MTSKGTCQGELHCKNSGVKKGWIKPQKTELVTIVRAGFRKPGNGGTVTLTFFKELSKMIFLHCVLTGFRVEILQAIHVQ